MTRYVSAIASLVSHQIQLRINKQHTAEGATDLFKLHGKTWLSASTQELREATGLDVVQLFAALSDLSKKGLYVWSLHRDESGQAQLFIRLANADHIKN